MKPIISILGCGWLGFPLAIELVSKGYLVKGSSRSRQKLQLLEKKGIKPYYIDFNPLGNGPKIEDFFAFSIIIIAIPPSTPGLPSYFHPNQIMNIRDLMKRSGSKACIYISSTAVYPDLNGPVNEETGLKAENERYFATIRAEKILMEGSMPYTIIRCGGLMGYDRDPVNYLAHLLNHKSKSGRQRKSADTPVNYVHRDDVIGIIKHVLEKECWGQIFNAVAPMHPSRREIILSKYPEALLKENGELDQTYKIVDGAKVNDLLDYHYKYPNPLQFSGEHS